MEKRKIICFVIFSAFIFIYIFLRVFYGTISESQIKDNISKQTKSNIKILNSKDTAKEKIFLFTDLNYKNVGLAIYEKRLNRYYRKIIGYNPGFYCRDCFTITENNKTTASISIGGLKANKNMAYFTISLKNKVLKGIIKDNTFLETYTLESNSSSDELGPFELKFYDVHNNDITSELESKYKAHLNN